MSAWLEAIGWGAGFVLLVMVSGFFSAMSAAVVAVNRFRLRYGPQDDGGPRIRRVLALFDDTQRIHAVSIIGSAVAHAGAMVAAVMAWRAAREFGKNAPLDWPTAAVPLVAAALVLLVFGEMTPRRLLRQGDYRIVFWLYYPSRWSLITLGPVAFAGIWLGRQIAVHRGMTALPPDALAPSEPWQTLLEPEPEPSLSAAREEISENRMLHGVFGLEKTLVREVMRPLVDLVVIHLPETIGVVRERVRQTGYSRFPVYRDRITNLAGYLDIYEILAAEPSDDQPADGFVREAFYVPETKRLHDLLQELLRGHHKVAIVVDEHGGCCGWVTREDVLEEIVGEIRDEFDEADDAIRQLDARTYVVSAAIHIDDLNERVALRLPPGEFDTLGGFIYDTLGRIPLVGDSFEADGVRYEVAEMDNRRIVSVKIVLPATDSPPAAPQSTNHPYDS
jgi:putative hemolysin